jgi:predicted nucleic acid-binding protein
MEEVARHGPPVSTVLDSSITLAFIFSDEVTDSVRAIFDRAVAEGFLVPQHWRMEMANALTMAVRRGRIDAEFRRAAIADLTLLTIETDPHTNSHIWSETLAFADRFRLTLYDAAYLELAYRRGLPLATLDDELREAAKLAGVECLPG